MASSQNDDGDTEDELPTELQRLRSRDYVHQLKATGPKQVSDFFTEIEPLPTDLVVPSEVWARLDEADQKPSVLGKTKRGNHAIRTKSPSALGSKSGESIERIERLCPGASIYREEGSAIVEVVVDSNDSNRPVDHRAWRPVKQSTGIIDSVHNHDHRSGYSIYLVDTKSEGAEPTTSTLKERLAEREREQEG